MFVDEDELLRRHKKMILSSSSWRMKLYFSIQIHSNENHLKEKEMIRNINHFASSNPLSLSELAISVVVPISVSNEVYSGTNLFLQSNVRTSRRWLKNGPEALLPRLLIDAMKMIEIHFRQ